MVRRGLLVVAATVLGALVAPAAPAIAGSGCHAGVTTGHGDTVEMVKACFTPTTLRVDPGATVTFVNKDPMTHNVGGNLWGNLEAMNQGEVFTATFTSPGIYPYACSYHPGMTAAIVVGKGTGVGNGEAVTVASYEVPASSPETAIVATAPAAEDPAESSAAGWVLGGSIGLGLGLAAGVAIPRRRRHGSTAS
jgi:plastocyanin